MSGADEPTRRSTHVDHEVVYAEVGASAQADLLRFPPAESSPFERELKLGSGAERFLVATSTLMTWGAQRAAGIEVSDIRQSENGHYEGVTFDSTGTPQPAPEAEVKYGPDGEAFLNSGATATLRWPDRNLSRKVRVVYVVDEVRRSGFAIGTVDDRGVVGETAYIVEHRDDDSVWALTRGFYWAPRSGLFGLRAKTALRLARDTAERQIAALAPGVALGASSEGK